MRYFSLFSGIGGFELGIEQAKETVSLHTGSDIEREKTALYGESAQAENRGDSPSNIGGEVLCVGCAEIDRYASAIYRYHYPEVTNYGDATKIDYRRFPDFELLTFGWPCQDNSIAGKRQGQTESTRSGLLGIAVEILRRKKLDYFVAENVPGLFSVNGGYDFYDSIRMFTEAGYDCQWQVLNTRWFLPQNRERIYFVGHLRGRGRPQVFPIRETSQNDVAMEYETKTTREYTPTLQARGQHELNSSMVLIQDKKGNVKNKNYASTLSAGAHSGGNHSDMDLIHLSNSNQRNVVYPVEGPSPALNTSQGGGLTPLVAQALQSDGMLRQGSSFGTNNPQSSRNIRRLTPRECERLQGFPDDFTKYGLFKDGTVKEISDTQRYKCIGNAVSVPVVKAVMERLLIA